MITHSWTLLSRLLGKRVGGFGCMRSSPCTGTYDLRLQIQSAIALGAFRANRILPFSIDAVLPFYLGTLTVFRENMIQPVADVVNAFNLKRHMASFHR